MGTVFPLNHPLIGRAQDFNSEISAAFRMDGTYQANILKPGTREMTPQFAKLNGREKNL